MRSTKARPARVTPLNDQDQERLSSPAGRARPGRLPQGGAKRSAAGDGVSRPPGGKRSAQRRPRREGVRD